MSDSDSDSEQKDREELPWHLSSFDHQIASPTQYFGDKQICPKPVPKKSQLELEDGNPAPNKALPQKNKPEDMQIQVPPKEINILLLGESGVGKSTFINSFANYMKHEHFEEAEKNSLSVLIPAKFTIFDKEYKRHTIEIGVNDGNECFDATSAATQDVKTYVFNITLENKPYLIRLVDTPGMGDPRGIAQDNQNCDYVLNYLSRLEKVHAICLLLNPTDRLYVFLNYCVTQILSRLEKSATQNICFLFTNTRGQSYTPGDTYTQLQLLVKKIKDTNNVTIPLSHANVFCFDNEAFRYLASIKQINVQFEEGTLESNIQSWKYSYKDIYRLLSYIVQLNPHDVQKTVSINHARKTALQLSQPLAEIVQLIDDKICTLDQHLSDLLLDCPTLDELKHKIHMPVIDISAQELPRPVTVCTSAKCSNIYKILEHKDELEKEHKQIVKCYAAFAHFFHKNVITPTNDSLKDYVRYLIGREEDPDDPNKETLDDLKKLLTEYEQQERRVLNESLKHDDFSSIAFNSPNMIIQKVEELFTLKYFGKKIKTTYDLHQSGDLREHNQIELVVKESYHLSLVSKTFRQ